MDFTAKKKSDFDNMNIVVVVDRGSASAAEILAGALKDNKRALVVGTKTFGKGSVQTVIPLKDKSALRLTTAAYYTPSGRNLRDNGIEPDIYVKKGRPAKTAEKLREEDKAKEKKKTELFQKVKKTKKRKEDKDVPEEDAKDGKKTDKEEVAQYDEQVQAAVNILKGVQIFEEHRAAAGKGAGEKEKTR
jgi:carboxyl-terminal processing protease